jgi:hypothetical protein
MGVALAVGWPRRCGILVEAALRIPAKFGGLVGKELVVLSQAVSSVAATAGELVRMYRESRVVDRAHIARLRADIALVERQARARNLAALARTNIDEIVATQRYIDELEPTGEALFLCLREVRQLSDELSYNLKVFARA